MRGLCKTQCGCMIEYEPHEFSDGFVYYLPRNLDKTIHQCALFQMFEELYDNPDPNLEEMYEENRDVIHYIAVYNENHPMPAKPEGVDEGIIRGAYLLRPSRSGDGPLVRLLGSGPIMLQAMAASEILESHGVRCEIWSVTSYGELRREAKANAEWNLLNKDSEGKVSWAEKCFADGKVTVAVSDNIAAVPDLIREWVGGKYIVLGTDGFGRSDTRDALRQFFRINAEHVALAALSGLVDTGVLHPDEFISIRDNLSISGEETLDITEI